MPCLYGRKSCIHESTIFSVVSPQFLRSVSSLVRLQMAFTSVPFHFSTPYTHQLKAPINLYKYFDIFIRKMCSWFLVVYPSVWCQNPPYLGYMILLHFREEPIQRQRRKITRHFVPRMYLFFRSMWESIASKYQCQSASDYSLILYSICALLCSFFHSLSAFDFCSFLSDTVSFSPFNEKNDMKSECGNNNNKNEWDNFQCYFFISTAIHVFASTEI